MDHPGPDRNCGPAGIVLWLLIATREGQPTLTFDGTTATYSGPETLAANEDTTFTLENSGDNEVAFAYAVMKDDWTIERAEATAESGFPPPWLAGYNVIADVPPGGTATPTRILTPGTYELYVWDWDTSRDFHATWIEVSD